MSEASNISRVERRMRQFKTHLEDQIFKILGNPRPDRVGIDTGLKALATDVILVGFYADKLGSTVVPLHDACKEVSKTLAAIRLRFLENVMPGQHRKFGFELQKLLEQLPF